MPGHHILFVLLLLAGVLLATPAMAADAIGSVSKVSGECQITRGGETLTAEQDLPILLKDEVSTGEGAALTVLFVDETTLSLAESSHASIDSYVYSEEASDLLFKFTKGTFRTITGGIVKQNPEGFNMETPLASIGIRGSDIYAIVDPSGEETGALHLGENHYVEVKTDQQTVNITESGMRVKISPTGVIFTPSRIPPSMFNTMMNVGSASKTPTGGSTPTSSGRTKSSTSGGIKLKTSTKLTPLKSPDLKSDSLTSPTSPTTLKTAPTIQTTPTLKTAPTLQTAPTAPKTLQTPTVQPTIQPITKTPTPTPTKVQPKIKLF